MKGRLRELTFDRSGRSILTIAVDDDCRALFDELADVDIDVEIRKHRKRRSLNANAYFHVLVNKIAQKQSLSDEDVKRQLVIDYGALARDEDGVTIGFKLPASVDASAIYPYCRCFDTREEGGKLFRCYLIYKHTHTLDTAEMARLIDGTITEAKELGIETATPDELARMKAQWAAEARKGQTP